MPLDFSSRAVKTTLSLILEPTGTGDSSLSLFMP